MALTDTKIRQTKAAEKPLALGVYPDVPLAAARKLRDAAREKLAAGVDPGEAKKVDKRQAKLAAANSFEAVARSWLEWHRATVTAGTQAKVVSRLETDVFPWLGRRPITEIDAPEILAVLKRIDSRGARYTARREISNVFRHGIKTGVCKDDAAAHLVGAIPPTEPQHYAAITEPARVGEMLRAFDAFSGTYPVACALKLAPLLFVRPGELRRAEWSQFDLDRGEWRYTAPKTNTDHLVPLATQAVAILRDLHALTGQGHSARTTAA